MTAALEVTELSKSFGGIAAMEGVSFAVAEGSLTALIGPNGAGKTTLFNLVTNLFAPDAGDIRFYGASLGGVAPHRIARLGLHRTFQTARVFPGMSAIENVLAGAHCQIRCGTVAQIGGLSHERPRLLRTRARLRRQARRQARSARHGGRASPARCRRGRCRSPVRRRPR